ncbi:hypothetical protein BJ546DRAFT_947645 [Cryomyces antarcticus]
MRARVLFLGEPRRIFADAKPSTQTPPHGFEDGRHSTGRDVKDAFPGTNADADADADAFADGMNSRPRESACSRSFPRRAAPHLRGCEAIDADSATRLRRQPSFESDGASSVCGHGFAGGLSCHACTQTRVVYPAGLANASRRPRLAVRGTEIPLTQRLLSGASYTESRLDCVRAHMPTPAQTADGECRGVWRDARVLWTRHCLFAGRREKERPGGAIREVEGEVGMCLTADGQDSGAELDASLEHGSAVPANVSPPPTKNASRPPSAGAIA